ncbi:hypothetical protein PVAP13_8KG210503 [Panicum virgatum]|uniref:Uncharacterized protein n=1 Tax=Panicum virgatum TaxID=38727 RepID=A0A8T0PLY1_PANVG|nr:hypothetical protein PVAP13_8KG210503 [Panicum virgatum]
MILAELKKTNTWTLGCQQGLQSLKERFLNLLAPSGKAKGVVTNEGCCGYYEKRLGARLSII